MKLPDRVWELLESRANRDGISLDECLMIIIENEHDERLIGRMDAILTQLELQLAIVAPPA